MAAQAGRGGRVSRRGFVAGAAALGLTAAMAAGPGEGAAAREAAKLDAGRVAAGTPGATKGIGFVLSHEQFPVPTLVSLGAAAEAAGFDTVWTSDHFQPWQANEGHAGHAWVTLAALGAVTGGIPFGTGVTCPTFRHHPAIVAEAFASLGLLYPGRVFLGVGSGEALNEQAATGAWAKWPERNERLIEAVDLIRQLWTGETTTYNGKYYRTVAARLYDVPARPVPIYMAANGLKAMYRAGRYGDGLITDPMLLMDYLHMLNFRQGALDAGKDPDAMPKLVEQFIVVGGEAEARQAAEYWRFLPKAWKPYVNVPDPVRINNRADVEVPLEYVYANWTVSEDPADHVAAIEKVFAAGATQIYIHSGQPDQGRVIDFYAGRVLPRLRASGVLG